MTLRRRVSDSMFSCLCLLYSLARYCILTAQDISSSSKPFLPMATLKNLVQHLFFSVGRNCLVRSRLLKICIGNICRDENDAALAVDCYSGVFSPCPRQKMNHRNANNSHAESIWLSVYVSHWLLKNGKYFRVTCFLSPHPGLLPEGEGDIERVSEYLRLQWLSICQVFQDQVGGRLRQIIILKCLNHQL